MRPVIARLPACLPACPQAHAPPLPPQVHTKLQAVLRRKDGHLAALRSELAGAEARQRQTEALLEAERAALLLPVAAAGAAAAVMHGGGAPAGGSVPAGGLVPAAHGGHRAAVGVSCA